MLEKKKSLDTLALKTRSKVIKESTKVVLLGLTIDMRLLFINYSVKRINFTHSFVARNFSSTLLGGRA